MTDTFVNVWMFIPPGERATTADLKKAYEGLKHYAAERGRVLVGEPIQRPSEGGIHLISETRPAE